MNIADFLPFELWKNALLHPKETFAKEKANATSITRGRGKYFAVNETIASLFFGVFGWMVGTFFGVINLPIMYVFSIPIGILFVNVIYWVVAKLFGGKGSLSAQYYVVSLYAAPLAMIDLIPLVGLVALIYQFYLTVLAISSVHKLSAGKAIAVVLMPIVLLLIPLVSALNVLFNWW